MHSLDRVIHLVEQTQILVAELRVLSKEEGKSINDYLSVSHFPLTNLGLQITVSLFERSIFRFQDPQRNVPPINVNIN